MPGEGERLNRSRAFDSLLIARSLSWVGDGVANVALVINLQDVEGTGAAVGLLLFVTMLPSLLAPFTGVVVDRIDRRLLLVGCEMAQAALGTLVVIWLPDLAWLLALIFVKSIAATIADIAARSSISVLVRPQQLVSANAWFGGARQAADVVGPVLGGVIVAAGSVRLALGVDVATFLAGVPLLLRLPALVHTTSEAAGGVLAGARAGLAYIARNRGARALAIAFFVLGLSAGDDVALPFLARDLGSGDVGIGVLYGAVAAGLVTAFAFLAGGRLRVAPMAGFIAGCVVLGTGNVMTGLSGAIAAAVAFQFVRGLGTAAVEVNLQTALQRSVPPEMLGRVLANTYGAVGVAAALSTAAAGPFLDATSPGVVLVASGACGIAAATIPFVTRAAPART